MRNPSRAVDASPSWQHVGDTIAHWLESLVPRLPEVNDMVTDLREGREISGLDEQTVAALRDEFMHLLGCPKIPGELPIPSMLRALGSAAQDADLEFILPKWLSPDVGAPLGFGNDIPTVGVFPTVDPQEPPSASEASIISDTLGWSNYISVEENVDVALDLVHKAKDNEFCYIFSSMEELVEFAGTDEITLQKLALVSKLRPDGTYKHRLVWDYLRSGTNAYIQLSERIVLPRIQDAAWSAVELRRQQPEEEGLEWLVLDFADAFHHIWLERRYWRYNCAKIGNVFVGFPRLTFGAKSCPNLWGRVAAAIGRATAAVVRRRPVGVQIYVDDPLLALGGSYAVRTLSVSILIIWFSVLSFNMSWQKASLGPEVDWIGAHFSYDKDGIHVGIPPKKVKELTEELEHHRDNAVVPIRRARSLAGSAGFIAGIIPWWKPFVAVIWAAITAALRELASRKANDVRKVAASRMLATKRYRHAVSWLLAFLRGWGMESRCFRLIPAPPSTWQVVMDASPWGMGAILFNGTVPVEYFAERLSSEDLRRFSASTGESKFTTLWEALTLLLSIRLWLVRQSTLRIRLKSDSLGALRLAMKLSSSSQSLNRIAQEIALHLALDEAQIDLLENIPGITNVQADALSRLYAPDAKVIPVSLVSARRVFPQERSPDFWRAWR